MAFLKDWRIEQSAGTSPTQVMSQKAITEALASAGKSIYHHHVMVLKSDGLTVESSMSYDFYSTDNEEIDTFSKFNSFLTSNGYTSPFNYLHMTGFLKINSTSYYSIWGVYRQSSSTRLVCSKSDGTQGRFVDWDIINNVVTDSVTEI